jgi:hypothetical protein
MCRDTGELPTRVVANDCPGEDEMRWLCYWVKLGGSLVSNLVTVSRWSPDRISTAVDRGVELGIFIRDGAAVRPASYTIECKECELLGKSDEKSSLPAGWGWVVRRDDFSGWGNGFYYACHAHKEC